MGRLRVAVAGAAVAAVVEIRPVVAQRVDVDDGAVGPEEVHLDFLRLAAKDAAEAVHKVERTADIPGEKAEHLGTELVLFLFKVDVLGARRGAARIRQR